MFLWQSNKQIQKNVSGFSLLAIQTNIALGGNVAILVVAPPAP
ncbi:MAG: hypothetical protein U0446_11875 [Dehalococcoidia bacterium]